MKIAVTASENTPSAQIDEQFGRCKYFIIFERETMKYDILKNPGLNMQSGAGLKAAEAVIKNGAQVLITGHVGNKAEDALKMGNVQIIDGYRNTIQVKDALNNFLKQIKKEV